MLTQFNTVLYSNVMRQKWEKRAFCFFNSTEISLICAALAFVNSLSNHNDAQRQFFLPE